MGIDAFQQEVARIALAAAGHGFALAGGNALIAHGIVERLTHDLDLFTSEPGGAGVVVQAVREALEAAGYRVEVLRPPERHGGQFAQMTVSRGDQSVGLDLAGDWRQHAPVTLEVGPVLHLEDAVGSKVTAMVGRGLPRDFVDVAAALGHYRREDLMRMAFARDPGLRSSTSATPSGAWTDSAPRTSPTTGWTPRRCTSSGSASPTGPGIPAAMPRAMPSTGPPRKPRRQRAPPLRYRLGLFLRLVGGCPLRSTAFSRAGRPGLQSLIHSPQQADAVLGEKPSGPIHAVGGHAAVRPEVEPQDVEDCRLGGRRRVRGRRRIAEEGVGREPGICVARWLARSVLSSMSQSRGPHASA